MAQFSQLSRPTRLKNRIKSTDVRKNYESPSNENSSSISVFWDRFTSDSYEFVTESKEKIEIAFLERKLILYCSIHWNYIIWYFLYINNVPLFIWLIIVPAYFSSLIFWIPFPYQKNINRRIDQFTIGICGALRHVIMNFYNIDKNYLFYFTLFDCIGLFFYFIGLVYTPSYFAAFCHFSMHIFCQSANVCLAFAFQNDKLENIA